ncbi:histone-like nucleoid-structuring protein Lsr2 [Streptomyces sp. 4F14]|uniref:histone-like nucleoid-structuring protein Lsr2 n=1 Tax=Streptomyces sp. 4F14 TaxID=3394380 RepID=UPI003A84D596
MAQKTVITLIDDLTGKEAGEGAETVTFMVDGKAYEIDLSEANAKKFRKAMAPYVDKARRGKTAPGIARARGAVSARGKQDTAAIRVWAKQNGYDVNDRGRIPANIQQAYAAATA